MKALISGSFDPVTNGHLDLIKRTASLFDTVIVGIFVNSSKKYYFSETERLEMLRDALKDVDNVEIRLCSGLVARYVEENEIDAVVKGVRNMTDCDYEITMAKTNKKIYGGCETLFLPSSPDVEDISSSTVKALRSYGEDVSAYVPACVLSMFEEKSKEI